MPTGTLTELIETTAAQRPDAAALPGLTWAEAATAVRRIAGGLARRKRCSSAARACCGTGSH
jgi:hypothetical protein